MRSLPFVKMHGIGNDYVYVDAFAHGVADPPALARLVSDRHVGIGSDGLILVAPPTPGAAADVRMAMFNADGSEGRMCGNGIRCVAKLAVDRGICRANPIRIETRRGVLAVRWSAGADGAVASARVDMGEPILAVGRIPAALPGLGADARAIAWGWGEERWRSASTAAGLSAADADHWILQSGIDPRISLVSMGNPHLVAWCRCIDAVPLARLGPALEHHPYFPECINVHVVEPGSGGRSWRMRTWERGSGLTQACGTGACAVAVAGALEGRGPRSASVLLPGGTLEVDWPSDGASVSMSGPAVRVFEGTLDLDAVGAGQCA